MRLIEFDQISHPSLEALRGSISLALYRAKELTQKENLETPEGKLALTFLLTTASLLKSAGPNLSKEIGGETANPEREIDLVGGEVMDILTKEFLSNSERYSGSEVFIEERKTWEVHPKGAEALSGKDARKILVDPCDETSSELYKSVAISIFDKEGEFLAGGVAGLKDEIVVFVEGDKVNFVGLDGGKNSDKDPLLVFAPGASEHLRFATLGRRLNDKEMWKFFDKSSPKGLNLLLTFGGYGLIKMIKGEVDMMLDPFKGQPWYEAAQWGALAERLGFSVDYDRGRIPDAASIVSEKTPKRIPIVISRNSQIHAKALQALKE